MAREVPAARALRQRNEHAQILDAAEIPRFKAPRRDRLDAADARDLRHAVGASAHRRGADGRGRLRLAKAARTPARGSRAGPTSPSRSPTRCSGFYAAITRQAPDGQPPGGWAPEERLTREEALRTFTLDAAYAAHAETRTGSLAAGKLADLVLLSHDIMTAPPAGILTTQVRITVIGGKVVYERESQ